MESNIYVAKLNNARVTPRKLRLVSDLVKGMTVNMAVAQLEFNNKDAAGLLLKVIKSAAANAMHTNQISASDLRVKSVRVGNGLNYKRGKAASRGRSRLIIRRGSNVTVELSQIDVVNK